MVKTWQFSADDYLLLLLQLGSPSGKVGPMEDVTVSGSAVGWATAAAQACILF